MGLLGGWIVLIACLVWRGRHRLAASALCFMILSEIMKMGLVKLPRADPVFHRILFDSTWFSCPLTFLPVNSASPTMFQGALWPLRALLAPHPFSPGSLSLSAEPDTLLSQTRRSPLGLPCILPCCSSPGQWGASLFGGERWGTASGCHQTLCSLTQPSLCPTPDSLMGYQRSRWQGRWTSGSGHRQ